MGVEKVEAACGGGSKLWSKRVKAARRLSWRVRVARVPKIAPKVAVFCRLFTEMEVSRSLGSQYMADSVPVCLSPEVDAIFIRLVGLRY